jgi:hypothetical protein
MGGFHLGPLRLSGSEVLSPLDVEGLWVVHMMAVPWWSFLVAKHNIWLWLLRGAIARLAPSLSFAAGFSLQTMLNAAGTNICLLSLYRICVHVGITCRRQF